MSNRNDVIKKISALPTLPVIAQKLLSKIEDPETGAKDIAEILQYDPALTANVLKAANSAFLGFSDPVESVNEACFRIGTKWVMQIALSSLIYSNLSVPVRGYDLSAEELWKHSVAVAIMAENFCSMLNIKENGLYYTAGLLHDIGKIAMENAVSELYEVLQQAIENDHITFEEAEEKFIGMDHAEAGAMVAENWAFPKPIVDAIRWHHKPEMAEKNQMIVDVIHVSDAVCLMQGIGIGRDGLQYRCSDDALKRLNFSSNDIEEATSRLLASLEDLENMFSQKTDAPSAVGR